MIIWINGAFGAGKTQTAHELHRRIPNSCIYDPENAGYFLRENLPASTFKADFQDMPMWRTINHSLLSYINKEYKGVIIVPMTIVNPVYFSEIIGELRKEGVTIHHYVLWASKPTLVSRLKGRGERKASWAINQIDRCMEGLSNSVFENRINTDNITVAVAAKTIAALSDVQLLPDNRSFLRKKWDHFKLRLRDR
ncbi:AAA family ATPase [Paenibacillus alvei]